MDESLRFFQQYEGWVYFFLIIGALVYIRRMAGNWGEMRATIFGLERDRAQQRFTQAVTALVLLILIGVGEFVIVSYVIPVRPAAVSPLATATIDPLATPTVTSGSTPEAGVMAEPADGTPAPTPTVDARLGTCVANRLEITSPRPGEPLRGEVVIEGSATADSFGFYKVEFTPQNQATWRAISAGDVEVTAGILISSWDTSIVAPGDYLLRLVVITASAENLPDCQVPITILPPEE
jgi:hypothetical protein